MEDGWLTSPELPTYLKRNGPMEERNESLLLEMMITAPDRVVTEPLGVYDTMRKRNKQNKVRDSRPEMKVFLTI